MRGGFVQNTLHACVKLLRIFWFYFFFLDKETEMLAGLGGSPEGMLGEWHLSLSQYVTKICEALAPIRQQCPNKNLLLANLSNVFQRPLKAADGPVTLQWLSRGTQSLHRDTISDSRPGLFWEVLDGFFRDAARFQESSVIKRWDVSIYSTPGSLRKRQSWK